VNVRVQHGGVTRLAADMAGIPPRAGKDMVRTVRRNVKAGNALAKANAKESAGRHGKHYPKSFTTEMTGLVAGGLIAGEYGPDASRQQGGMSFEFGSRNQKPHLDLARSADIIGPALAGEVRRLPDGWFW